jgi:RNA polymerase sigma-70 factor (ECF subfamily)
MAERAQDEAFDFENFTRENYTRVVAYLLSRVRNLEQAQDLAQETFLQAHRGRASYDPGKAGRLEWVMGIARNVSAYAARRQSALAQKMPLVEALVQKAWANHGPPGASEDDRLAALRKCLGTLTERARVILELLYEAGFTYDEVSQQMGMGTGAVKVAASRARQALMECVRRRTSAAPEPS